MYLRTSGRRPVRFAGAGGSALRQVCWSDFQVNTALAGVTAASSFSRNMMTDIPTGSSGTFAGPFKGLKLLRIKGSIMAIQSSTPLTATSPSNLTFGFVKTNQAMVAAQLNPCVSPGSRLSWLWQENWYNVGDGTIVDHTVPPAQGNPHRMVDVKRRRGKAIRTWRDEEDALFLVAGVSAAGTGATWSFRCHFRLLWAIP